MDRQIAVSQLPDLHAQAIRLRDRGFDPSDIALELDLPAESMSAVLDIADAKLARLLAASDAEATSEGGAA